MAWFPVRVWRHFLIHNGFLLAAGVSYQALFAILRRDLRRLRDRGALARRQRRGRRLRSSSSSTATSRASSPIRRHRDARAGPGDRVAELRGARLDRRHRPRRVDLDRDRIRHLRAPRGARHLRHAAGSAQLLPAQGTRPAGRGDLRHRARRSAPSLGSIGTWALNTIVVAPRPEHRRRMDQRERAHRLDPRRVRDHLRRAGGAVPLPLGRTARVAADLARRA